MSKAISITTCSCATDLTQLNTEWNSNINPDLANIAKRLRQIKEQHLTHSTGDSPEFDTLHRVLQGRLQTDQSSSPDFLKSREVKKSTGARLLLSPTPPAPSSPAARGATPTVPPIPRSPLTRHHTEYVPSILPSSPTSSGTQQTPKTAPLNPQEPSSDSSKKSE